MGYDLQRWALTKQHPCLTPRTRQVLAAISFVAHDEHGEFWMRSARLIAEHFPDLSHAAYRNHLSILVRNGLLIKMEHGGGRTSGGRGKSSIYRVNAPSVSPQQPPQGVLPEIARSPDTSPPNPAPEVLEQSNQVDASAAHRRLDEMFSAGITPTQVIAILDFTARTLLESPESPDRDAETGQVEIETCKESTHVSEKHARKSGGFRGNMQADLACFDEETCKESEKHARKSGGFLRNMQEIADAAPIHEEKRGEEKKDHAAAAELNLSGFVTGFFDQLAKSLSDFGYSGIRAAQFADLTGFLAEYTNVTGSPPDQRTAEYIVGRLRDSSDVRNVVGFVRSVTEDVLRTGEGYVAYEPPSTPLSGPPTEHESAVEPPDWHLLHLAHVEQVAPAQQTWVSALERLRAEVSRPAFETWLSESRGVAYVEGRFVVGTANRFAAEMLGHRLHPLVERAVRDVTGEVLVIEYAVEAQGNEECPVCEGAEKVNAAEAG